MAMGDGGFVPAGGFVATLVGADGGEAARAVALAGGRVGARLAWDAADWSAATGTVVAVEAEGVDAATLERALPRIAALLDADALALVAAIDVAQIDLVAVALMGPQAVLLCAPTLTERVAALAVAAGASGTPGAVREDDADRFRELNEEVARLAAVLARLAGESGTPASTVDDRRTAFGVAPAAPVAIAASEIRQAIRARRLRAQFFEARLLEDPGWDMLLDLFAAELEGAQVSVSSLCIAAAVAPTTALRWITRMVDAGLFVRAPDADDRRRAFLTLTAQAGAAMRGYVAAVRRAGLAIV